MTTAIRNSKANYNRTILRENMNDPKNFWKTIKRYYPSKSKRPNPTKLFNTDGGKVSDVNGIANGFCSYFSKIASCLQQTLAILHDPIWENRFDLDLRRSINPDNKVFTFHQIHCQEALYELKNINPSKATGFDNLPAALIKLAASEIAYPFSLLANRFISEAVFPNSEKCAKIVPLYKSGEKSQLDNYRPISILPAFSKVIERLIYRQLHKYLKDNKFLSPAQFGFRSGRCTSQAVLRLTEHIRKNMDIGNLTGAVYIDLRKAFDTVHHGCLLTKLSYYGIVNNELKWFEDYLFGRSQFVQYNSVNSEVEAVTCGAPQGSILGPLMFVVFINDLDIALKKTNLILFADDTVVYYSGKSSEEIIKILNDDLQELGKWFKENNLVINMKKGKTEFVLYRTAKRIAIQQPSGEQINVTICGENVNQSASYDYLGVTLDSN